MKMQIWGILIDPGCEPVIQKLPCTQTGLQALLGGTLLCRRFPQEFAALLYLDQGSRNTLPNRMYRNRWYFGRLLIVGWRNDKPVDLPPDLAQTLAARWARVNVEEEPAGPISAAATAVRR